MKNIRKCLLWCLEQAQYNVRHKITQFQIMENEDYKGQYDISFWNERIDMRQYCDTLLDREESDKLKQKLVDLDFEIEDYR